ncbi:MAG: ribonuclease D, partial [Rhodospirillales bacterium]|nr:ribonuclease D [Rhodospirillales bacterium]
MDPITDTAELSAFCKRAAKSKFVTVDTEFIREKTYWPVLCLVQVATEDEAVIIDAVAPGIDLASLFALMADKKVLKVFHAARQDVEIFVHLGDIIPTPIFDTQVAAMVCGFGDSVGYDKLVASLVNEHIDKSLRFTDWSRRPLNAKQLDYALSDVTHLRVVYEKLAAKLDKNQRASWLDEEMAVLTTPSTYKQDPNLSWRRIKSRLRKTLHLAILRELAAWREIEAQARDVPRNRVLRDEAMTDIAAHEPSSASDLFALRSMAREKCSKTVAETIIGIIAKTKTLPASEHPKLEHDG